MVTTIGRDPAWTSEAMGKLWAHATKLNLSPLRWELGLFNTRDLMRARDPNFQGRPYEAVRLETAWGCSIAVVSLWDTVALVAFDQGKPKDEAYQRFVAGES